MNNQQIMQHTMKALDGSGHEHKPLWSEKTIIEQHNICEDYFRYMPDQEYADALRERAARAYYNIIARDMKSNNANDSWELA